jgi:hypothetical protein
MANDQSDWRLLGQEKYLVGVPLQWAKWTVPDDNPDWDHDHCDFCWQTFMSSNSPEVLQEGYTTEDRRHWICLKCYEDFKDRLHWKVKKES